MYTRDGTLLDTDEGSYYNDSLSESPEDVMQAAGRRPDQPFKDLRSANHAYQRSIKRPRKIRSRKIYWIFGLYGYNRNLHTLEKAEDNRFALFQGRPWEEDFEAQQRWKEELEWMEEPHHYDTFGTWRHAEQIGDNGKGEDFGMWGRRRIEEMRRVKEARIRKQLQSKTHSQQTSPRPSLDLAREIPDTTLPTNDYDKHGHMLLREVLTLPEHRKRYLLRHNLSPYTKIHGFYWFGEFSWRWHRDSQGFWVFGDGDCSGGCIPCACCGCGLWRCACEEWVGKPAPDDVQSCSLIEWTKGELRTLLVAAEMVEAEILGKAVVLDEAEEKDKWEIMSYAGSDGWSVLSEEEAFEFL